MHHKYGLSTTPAYKDGIVFATFGNELYAFDADIRDKKDEGIRDEPQGRDRHDIGKGEDGFIRVQIRKMGFLRRGQGV